MPKLRLVKPRNYGICIVCGSAIAIPGLEAYLCSGDCRWVRYVDREKLLKAKHSKRKRKAKSAKDLL